MLLEQIREHRRLIPSCGVRLVERFVDVLADTPGDDADEEPLAFPVLAVADDAEHRAQGGNEENEPVADADGLFVLLSLAFATQLRQVFNPSADLRTLFRLVLSHFLQRGLRLLFHGKYDLFNAAVISLKGMQQAPRVEEVDFPIF